MLADGIKKQQHVQVKRFQSQTNNNNSYVIQATLEQSISRAINQKSQMHTNLTNMWATVRQIKS